jgi:hypothetical protein
LSLKRRMLRNYLFAVSRAHISKFFIVFLMKWLSSPRPFKSTDE